MLARPAHDAVISQLNGNSRTDAYEAAKQVWNLDGKSLAKPLIKVLRSGRRPFNRAAAAYAMQAVRSFSVISALERVVGNKSENPKVRGQAAESLAHFHRKSTHRLLLEILHDPSGDVRFWCAFALGEMREKQAVPALRLLLSDQRQVWGFHSVAKEAADAITEIQKRGAGRRCLYCVRSARSG